MDLIYVREQLLAARRQRRLSQTEAGAAIGVSQSMISKIETGATTDWGVIRRLCALYELVFDDLAHRAWGFETELEQAIRRAPEISPEQRSLLLVIYKHMSETGPLAPPTTPAAEEDASWDETEQL